MVHLGFTSQCDVAGLSEADRSETLHSSVEREFLDRRACEPEGSYEVASERVVDQVFTPDRLASLLLT